MRLPLLLWFATAVDLLRGAACFVDPHALNATSMWQLQGLPHRAAGMLGVGASVMTIIWLLEPMRNRWAPLMVAPQWVVFCLGASSSLHAVSVGHYADGTQIAPAHIFADQIGWVLLPVFYGAAVISEIKHRRTRG
ncbi:MAG TPA: hypothetical protein VGQ73_04515 [Gemmatimonadales bacterium]|jgi:hypothetical protein|nr:hypothetical protein [Gemmatimonadales bacterium]